MRHWGFEIQCRNADEYSSSLTAVRLPEGHSADALRAEILARCNMSLGNGLGPLADKVFRIGHLGALNDLMVLTALAGAEMALHDFGADIQLGSGVGAAQRYLAAGPAEQRETALTALSAGRRWRRAGRTGWTAACRPPTSRRYEPSP